METNNFVQFQALNNQTACKKSYWRYRCAPGGITGWWLSAAKGEFTQNNYCLYFKCNLKHCSDRTHTRTEAVLSFDVSCFSFISDWIWRTFRGEEGIFSSSTEKVRKEHYYWYYCWIFFQTRSIFFQVLSCFYWGQFCGEWCRNSHIQEVNVNIIVISVKSENVDVSENVYWQIIKHSK